MEFYVKVARRCIRYDDNSCRCGLKEAPFTPVYPDATNSQAGAVEGGNEK